MTKPILINTRPSHRGLSISQLSGVQVLKLPLLEIVSLPIDGLQQAMMDRWLAGEYQVLVITSVEAARRALAYMGRADKAVMPTTPIIAVGQTTAQVLIQQGFSVVLPEVANNEGMLALPQIARLKSADRVLIWCGVGGRRLLKDTLLNRGVQIDEIHWYRRDLPAGLTEQFVSLQPAFGVNKIYVLISSQMAYETWQNLPHRHAYHYLTLGDRLTQIVQSHESAAHISQINTLDPDEIYQAIFFA